MASSSSNNNNPYHEERFLFARLVLTIGRDPYRTVETISLWLWLCQCTPGSRLIHRILSMTDRDIHAVAVEAESILDSLLPGLVRRRASARDNDVPITAALLNLPVNIHYFRTNRESVSVGMSTFLGSLRSLVFEDLATGMRGCLNVNGGDDMNINLNMNMDLSMNMNREMRSSQFLPFVPHGEGTSNIGRQTGHLLVNPTATAAAAMMANEQFNRIVFMNHFLANLNNNNNPLLMYPEQMMMNNPSVVAPPRMEEVVAVDGGDESDGDDPLADERTLFVTFSRGFPLTEEELREFFTRRYGAIEKILIQETPMGIPPLYAKIMFYSPLVVNRIIRNLNKVKFLIGGKHVWARRYISKKKKKVNGNRRA
ncbi:hypothetical protein QJS10_CPB04g01840 [Acorus calamus]|uniref:RRM domain-containing protein n=1 Tax=Acorus calamus TaxID=4465 RepID=A0AAV9F2S3_ACOCL|nr:hypothetical protein QJS10_CPB04g01840 [Acorus calamus]